MSEFKELVKSFAKSREYVRDFFVYGFKTREEFTVKSTRTYDNEKRRLESWFPEFVKEDFTGQGKNISLAIDGNLLDTNPLYRVWKMKSFTDNDITLHFLILDCLQREAQGTPSFPGYTAERLTDALLEDYDVIFDAQTVRRKCNDYAKCGLLLKEKYGKEFRYMISPPLLLPLAEDMDNPMRPLSDALSFYQLSAPLGCIANTIMDTLQIHNDTFRVKHGFLVHTLEDEVLLELLFDMKEKCLVKLELRGSKTGRSNTLQCVPLQFFTSTRTGRRFLCAYLQKARRFSCIRMDSIKKVLALEPVDNYDTLKNQLIENHDYLWGVSFQNTEHIHRQWVRLTLHIAEPKELFIVSRLEKEGRGGIVTRIDDNTYTYEIEVFDAHEMMPWIRTFTGRILEFKSSSPQLESMFYNDLNRMYEMYEIYNI